MTPSTLSSGPGIEENVRLLRMIRDEPGWALARVQRAAELEAEFGRLREALTRVRLHAQEGDSWVAIDQIAREALDD